MWVESLHDDAPWQMSDGAQLRALSVETQAKWQLESHPCEPSLVPSSHSSEPVTIPSPHTGAWHAPSRQMLPLPHEAPAGSAPESEQVKSFPHVPVPLHGSCGSQCAFPRAESLGTQLSVQSRSQPAFGPFCSPLSHSSGVCRTPSPQRSPASGSRSVPCAQARQASSIAAIGGRIGTPKLYALPLAPDIGFVTDKGNRSRAR